MKIIILVNLKHTGQCQALSCGPFASDPRHLVETNTTIFRFQKENNIISGLDIYTDNFSNAVSVKQ